MNNVLLSCGCDLTCHDKCKHDKNIAEFHKELIEIGRVQSRNRSMKMPDHPDSYFFRIGLELGDLILFKARKDKESRSNMSDFSDYDE